MKPSTVFYGTDYLKIVWDNFCSRERVNETVFYGRNYLELVWDNFGSSRKGK